MTVNINRRRVLRGITNGAAITVALPFLDSFLNDNGTALASGRPLPVRFGTWFWGLGVTPGRWVPTQTGAGYDILPELKHLESFKNQINVLSGFDVKVDGKANVAHQTGTVGCRTGNVPKDNKSQHPTLDVVIADAIGTDTRFRSLELTATGNPKDTYSWRNSAQLNPSEGSPLDFYTRVFGPEFQDPNASEFTPDPAVMLRKSVLSGVAEERADLVKRLNAGDRARLDEYFTSLRQLENQLELMLQKPPPAEACVVSESPAELPSGYEIDTVVANHKLMAQLLALALACNQTKVFNLVYSNSGSNIRKAGESTSHHQLTHEELPDKDTGYQMQSAWFVERSMEAFAVFLSALDGVREGDGTLLRNTLVFAHTDTNFAKSHSVTAMPSMTAGSAGGRLKTGIHIASNGEPITRVGLTLQQAMGLPVGTWGTESMTTSSPLSQLLA